MSAGFGSAPAAFLLILGLVAIGFTSFLSAIEVAIGRLSRAYVEGLIEDGVKRAPELLPLVEHRNRTNLALRGARVTFQTVAIVSMTVAIVDIFNDFSMPWWGVTLIALVGISLIEFVLVSLLPWLLGGRSYVRVALWGTPLTRALVSVSKLFNPLLRKVEKRREDDPAGEVDLRLLVAEDLREIVDEVGEPETFDDEDKVMLRSFFELGQTRVREVMVPRTSMVTIDSEATLDETLELFINSGFSRIPVIGSDIDEVIGIAYLKDIVRRVHDQADVGVQPVRSYVRAPNFVPEMRLVDDELRDMQDDNTHLALVVDEYGGIAGLVTLEDIIEELVGEVKDEHDRYEMEAEPLGDNTWRVPARFPLNDLEELVGVDLEVEEVDSVGGLLTAALGKIPHPGSSAESHGLRLTAGPEVGRRHEITTIVVAGPDLGQPSDTADSRNSDD